MELLLGGRGIEEEEFERTGRDALSQIRPQAPAQSKRSVREQQI